METLLLDARFPPVERPPLAILVAPQVHQRGQAQRVGVVEQAPAHAVPPEHVVERDPVALGDRAQHAMETRQEPVHGKKAYLGRGREQARDRPRERDIQPLIRIDALDRQTT